MNKEIYKVAVPVILRGLPFGGRSRIKQVREEVMEEFGDANEVNYISDDAFNVVYQVVAPENNQREAHRRAVNLVEAKLEAGGKIGIARIDFEDNPYRIEVVG